MSSSPRLPEAPLRGAGSSSPPGFVLVVDDEPLLLRALARILRPEGHRVEVAETPGAAHSVLADPDLEVVLLDLRLGAASGLELLDRIKAERPEVEVLVMTGHATIESAVDCMRQGAFDYLAKPFDDVHRVRTTVQRAIERRRLMARNRELEAQLEGHARGTGLVGHAPGMRRLVRTIESLRNNESHVLIQGESGTGKELVARAVHFASRRHAGAFVPVDCGALPESVIESELFGHQRGAFTGAVGAPGLFRMAEGGTLFLDEIGEIPLATQAKLLRALQYKEVRAVGAATSVSVDIRVITATHRDLAAMVETGRFRTDLFYRLNVVRIEIPPLRERIEDVPLLAQHFLDKHARARGAVSIDDAALERLMSHDWPGNVRELENVIESALALARGPRLRAADLPIGRSRTAPMAGSRAAAGESPPGGLPLSLEAYERSALERALREAGGNATEAARRLGIGRSTFYRKLGKHGLSLDAEAAADLVERRGIG
jgi:two-component system, NtrC family, response regulator HydG